MLFKKILFQPLYFFFFFNVLLTIPLSVVVKFTSMFFSVGTTNFRDEHQMDFKWEKKFSM